MMMRRLRIRFFLGLLALFANIANLHSTDSGRPNPSARFKSSSAGFDVVADLLVFCAQESGSENWAEAITTSDNSTHCDVRDVRFNWNAGLRIGLGYGMSHDGWDTQFYYTWFRTQGSDHVSSAPGAVFSSFLGNFYVDNSTGSGISGVAYQKASILWTIHFRMLDWELGKNFWVSKALSLRPFIGLKGGWIDQSIRTKWQNPNRIGAEFFHTAREDLQNNFGGVGPSVGLNTRWDLAKQKSGSFSLFGDFSGALVWGHWTFKDVYKNDIHQKVDVKLSPINAAASMLRAFMGFGWDTNIWQDRAHFSAR